MSSLEETEMMAEETVKAFGRIDILVNCAATVSGLRRRRFFEIDPGEWDRVMAVNMKGSWLCTRAVSPHMRKEGKGSSINLSSDT